MIGGVGALVILFASFSRSAYLAAVAALGIVGVMAWRPSRRALAVTGGLFGIAMIGLLLVSTGDWFSNVILHEDPESTIESKSNAAHVASLRDGMMRGLTQPIGAGVGSTGSASLYDASPQNDLVIENYYLFVAHESGWVGLAVFIALFGLVLRALWRRRSDWLALAVFASGIGLGLIALLLPVWTDETVALIWWGLAGAITASSRGIIGGRHAKGTRQQKTTGTA
jgi:hypothetical protein